ncbi:MULTISPECIES: hypothetical protein [unclassified Lentimicrobium]|uniref:hypothetical protein n=1 Tax=unclassified Lentimicrobium TaxID=2677434 RepID=UPI0015522E1C|nr:MULTISPECIES: hypothetical protein [unclassified Lentimicrobium]NPD47664.1 hypothetical protein [Lentimicrobium sp. S6]NPD86618.1 hypothetical protein [Lentimicrobium sp. L6]
MKSFTYPLLLSALLFGLIFTACKKDEREVAVEPEQKTTHVFVTSSPESNVYITAIEVRIDHEEWSESLMGVGQAIFPSETQDYYINIPKNKACEFRLGVFSDSLYVSMLHLQEYWDDFYYPYILGNKDIDSITLKVKQNQYTGFVSVSAN